MIESHTIERFLENNSDIRTQPTVDAFVVADLRTRYRPDKLFPRDPYMKWDMIFNGIDTPHRLAKGAEVVSVDRTWLATELKDFKDFEI